MRSRRGPRKKANEAMTLQKKEREKGTQKQHQMTSTYTHI